MIGESGRSENIFPLSEISSTSEKSPLPDHRPVGKPSDLDVLAAYGAPFDVSATSRKQSSSAFCLLPSAFCLLLSHVCGCGTGCDRANDGSGVTTLPEG